MRRPQGYITATEPGAPLVEADTFTCGHCQRIKVVIPGRPPSDVGGFCAVCDSLICELCVGKACKPWEKQMEEQEARDALFRSIGTNV